MKRVNFLIFGAGPSGLTLAHSLLELGVPLSQVLVVEKEADAGGLCRSKQVDGAPLDIGGGHFLDVRKKDVLDFLFKFMPIEEWNRFDRVSKILLRGQMIDHPLESNLWQFEKSDQVDYLESIARAGCVRDEPMPDSFSDWIRWKFGDRIAEEYMLPYNRKIWSMDLSLLGTYWLHKLPNVSFRETLRSCLEDKPFGALPAHGTFLYPKEFGYGEVWKRMADALGESLITNCDIKNVDLSNLTVNGVWEADKIITTIPWTFWAEFCNVPDNIKKSIYQLEAVSIDVEYFNDQVDSDAHWIYEPNEMIPHHRFLLRSNFCTGARGYWTETNSKRSLVTTNFRYHNRFAYPVNTVNKQEMIAEILQWAETYGVYGAGRWGKWEHMNSDIAVAEAMSFANDLVTKDNQ